MATSQFSFEQLVRIRAGARRLSEDAAEHEGHVQDLLAAAETNLNDARAALLGDDSTTSPDGRSRAMHAHLVRSSAHVDTTRRLCLDARRHHLAAERLVMDLDQPGAGKSGPPLTACGVLVVDDYEDSREVLSLLLRNAGFRVETACNGLEALICAYEMQPAVIVMDLMMPVLDGFEAARLIKAIDALSDTRVIAYTARAPQPDTGDLFSAVIRKPSPPDVVVDTVRRCAAA
jgi:CheY-like chemotaxis protein